jgi:thiamine-phosphate pyrophosphorylase
MANHIVCYVTDRKLPACDDLPHGLAILLEKIRFAVRCGVDWVQIREKDMPGRELLAVLRDSLIAAKRIAVAERRAETRIYVNDRLDVALAAGAAGVHLGGESLPVGDVVRWCRDGNARAGFQVGVSCHSVEAVIDAEQSGANYVFFGPVFDTPAKREFGPPQGIERLRDACGAVGIPVIAIGGVNESNAQDCIRAGAAGIAAIRLFQDATGSEALPRFLSSMHEEG